MKTKKVLSLVLAVLLVVSMAACKKNEQKPTTLVIATDAPSGIFNPLFAIEAADSTIAGYIGGECILPIDRNGELVMQGTVEGGEKRVYEGVEYAYQSMVAVEVKSTEGEGDAKKTVYSFTVKNGVKFSDGHEMNIDDVIFTWYVLADPSYNGAEMFMYSPVEGVDYYYSGIPASSYDSAAEKYDALFTQVAGNVWTADDVNALDADAKAFVEFAGKVWADNMLDLWYGYTEADQYIADASAYYGWTIPAGTSFEEAKLQFGMAEVLGYIFAYDDGDSQSGRALIRGTYIQQMAEPGEVPNISGIVKTGDMTADVTVLGGDATALYKVVRYAVLPLHHYGNEAEFDASANKFGFTKGDLSGVIAKHNNPLGAGPYAFVSNENNIVTLKANEHYFKGAPKIQYLNFRVTPVNDRINDVASGEVDIASVDASKLNLDQINAKAGAVGAVTSTAAGYGYVGINASSVCVGDGGSEASKNLRKGIATLISVYRTVGIKSFFGEVGQSIEVPMSKTWFGYPENPALAYSTGVDGSAIYTAADAQDARVTAAKAAAKAFFEAAGYVFDANGKLAASQAEGMKTKFSVMFVAGNGGANDNAAVATLDLFKAAMEEMGFTVTYDQKSNYADQSATLASGTGYDLWAGTWSNPDRYVDVTQLYGSEGSTNYYHLYSATLDALVEEAKSGTPEERMQKIQAVYAEIMSWAVEVPLYQRVSITIYSSTNLKAESIPSNMTAYYGYFNEIHNLELAG